MLEENNIIIEDESIIEPVATDKPETHEELLTPEYISTKPDETLEYLKQARYEAGKKRLKLKQQEKANEALKKEIKEIKAKFAETNKALKAEEERKKQEAIEKAGDTEKVTLKLQNLAEEKKLIESQLKERDQAFADLEHKTKMLERNQFIDSLAIKCQIQWSNEFEKNGFLAKYSESKDGEFVFDSDDIQVAIKELKQSKHIPPIVPPVGPKDKNTQAPLETEILGILEKQTKGILLVPEEIAKLDMFQMTINGG
jgi:hypothetical protein